LKVNLATFIAIVLLVLAISLYFALVGYPLHPADYAPVALITVAITLTSRWLIQRARSAKISNPRSEPEKPKE
jgi:hypothetical protein